VEQSLVLDSRTEVGSKKFRGKLLGIGKDALDSTTLLAWRLGELTQASSVANDEQPYSEPSMFLLHVRLGHPVRCGRFPDHFGRSNNLSTDLP